METKQNSDSRKLLEGFRGGDLPAFETFYRYHKKPLFFYALSLAGNRDLAEDALQNFFSKLLKNLNSFLQAREFKVYLYRSLAREVASTMTKWMKRPDPERLTVKMSGDEKNISDDEWPNWLSILPEKQRDVVALKLGRDLTFEEISQLTGEPLKTVASQYWHGIRKLKEKFRQQENQNGR